MVVTGVSPELRGPLFSQVGRIVNSEVLRGSESLCQLLAYLASYAFSHPGVSAKEYQIATEVFGRAADFDPRLDSAVRVQTSRLRAKLAEYYAGPGAEDSIIIEIPRGAYSVAVHSRAISPDAVGQPASPAVEVAKTVAPAPRRWAIWLLSGLCIGLLVCVIYMVRSRSGSAGEARAEIPPALKNLWRGFTDAPDQTWVVFSNAEFVGRPETGMRYFDAARDTAKDKGSIILDYYTGIGEVMAIHELDQLFAQFGHGVLAKRGRLLGMDDVKNNDLIFVGSPSENLTLRDLPSMQDFVFRVASSGPRKGDLGIVNMHPGPGEPATYFGSAAMPYTEDYAVIGLMPGPTKQHWVMILAGTSTVGTQAAVEYVCSGASVEQLLKRAGRAGSELAPFEALIRVKIRRGVPVSSELVSVHQRET